MIPFLMKEHAKGNYPVDKLVSYYDFRDYQRALDDTKRGAAVKAVLVWKECVDAQKHIPHESRQFAFCGNDMCLLSSCAKLQD